MISTLILMAVLSQDPKLEPIPEPPGVSVLVYPPRYAIVQPPAYYYQPPVVVPPPVLVRPAPYAVQIGPRIVPRRPFLAWMGFPVHQFVVVP